MIDVTELPKEQLKKSKTWRRYVDESGRCSKCQEMAGLLDGCCGFAMNYEGGSLSTDELWDEIEHELKEEASERANDRED